MALATCDFMVSLNYKAVDQATTCPKEQQLA